MDNFRLHPYYVIFFLYVEPISALAGAVAALFPSSYLALLNPTSTASISSDPTVSTAVTQLANLYFYFAIVEATVLRAGRNSLPVWRALVTAMLIADFGHLLAGYRLGFSQFWDVRQWGPMEYGGIGFVYAGAATRILFLCGFGVRDEVHGREMRKMQ